ncbi:MAG: hypothetical protein AAGF46_05165 [Pseudomonadota bacterium]
MPSARIERSCGGALRTGLAVFLTVATLVACGGGNDSATAVEVASEINEAELALARKLYQDSERTPPGFYTERVRYPDRQVLLFHVRRSDLEAGVAAAADYDVCTDDFATALDWSQTAAAARGYDSTPTGNDTTDWYFEFDGSVQSVTPTVLTSRIFRCSAFDAGAASTAASIGAIRYQPLDGAALSFVVEYLWQFSVFNNALHAVLTSTGSSGDTELLHTLERAQLLPGAGTRAGCDRIELWRRVYSLDLTDGQLDWSDELTRSFDVQRTSGQVTRCQD